jgi:ATP-dependent RNA circularization protein (DNA/RNA ligase family)
MREYHKIQTIYKRDPATNMKTLLEGQFSEEAFAYLARNDWRFTEKVDGTNIRVMVQGGSVRFGGKTDDAQIPAFLVDRLQQRFLPQTEALNAQFPDGACLYGEGYGARIQKGGGNYRADQDFVLFDVKVGDWWLQHEAVTDIARQFQLDAVPLIGNGTLYDAVELARVGIRSTWGDFEAEGLVARPRMELKTRGGQRIIAKIKSRDFIVPVAK